MKKIFTLFAALLFISAGSSEAKVYKGAEYRTKDSFLYGRFEASIKSTNREGVLASLFTYYDGPDVPQSWNEIDIEILGRYNNDVQYNTITPGQVNHVKHQFAGFNPHLDFHTYAFEWTPSYVAWFIDGTEVYRQTGDHIKTLNKAQKLMMNIWNPGYPEWVGEWTSQALPAFAYYDWAAYYSYTPGSGSYGTNNNFTPQWRDEFDSWDQTRWDKASHTWDGNQCDFIYDNAVFSNGKLVLCLTNQTNIGLTDKKAPEPLKACTYGSGKVFAAFSEELDRTIAESKQYYSIPDVTIDSASLSADMKTVTLSVQGDLSSAKTLTILGAKDIRGNQAQSSIDITVNEAPVFPLKINVGGPAVNGYLADQEWKDNLMYGYLDGSPTAYSSSLAISGTDEDVIYQTERSGFGAYRVRVPNGKYSVKLMMAENYFGSSFKRIMDIHVEDVEAALNLDLYIKKGKSAAYELTIDVDVTDGIIDIHYGADVDLALLNGIVVEQKAISVEDGLGYNAPESFRIIGSYPNPFNGRTIIKYVSPKQSEVDIAVYDITGSLVFSKDLGVKSAGEHEFVWSARNDAGRELSSGIYFYVLRTAGMARSEKMVYLK
jgi:hypothetical protein